MEEKKKYPKIRAARLKYWAEVRAGLRVHAPRGKDKAPRIVKRKLQREFDFEKGLPPPKKWRKGRSMKKGRKREKK